MEQQVQWLYIVSIKIFRLNDETNSINSALANKADTNHWHANMKCRETNHWFSAEWNNNSLQLWIDATNVFDTANFQAGVSTLYNKCTQWGVTPSSNSPTDIANAIDGVYNAGFEGGKLEVASNPNNYNLFTAEQYNQNYTNGYNAGKAAGQSSVAGSYKIDFRVNAHDENELSWIRYRDWITIDVKSNGTASLGSNSFMNAQIRAEQGEYCNISKV